MTDLCQNCDELFFLELKKLHFFRGDDEIKGHFFGISCLLVQFYNFCVNSFESGERFSPTGFSAKTAALVRSTQLKAENSPNLTETASSNRRLRAEKRSTSRLTLKTIKISRIAIFSIRIGKMNWYKILRN